MERDDEVSQELAVQSLGMPEKGMLDVEASRAIAQIQSQMVMAKRFPRDENAAIARIKAAAGRRRLAEQSAYEYKRGGSRISGPSIRAAEVVGQAWGNLSMGVTELKRDEVKGESTMMAYCLDLETNVMKTITSIVPHNRDTQGGKKRLTDDRDVYETGMNNGSRRLRNCILATIPGDVMDDFMIACDQTLSKDPEPIAKRILAMLPAMEQVGVTKAMVENTLGCKAEAISERQLAQLRRQYQSLKDGFAKPADFFKTPVIEGTKDLNAFVKAGGKPKVENPDPATGPMFSEES